MMRKKTLATCPICKLKTAYLGIHTRQIHPKNLKQLNYLQNRLKHALSELSIVRRKYGALKREVERYYSKHAFGIEQ